MKIVSLVLLCLFFILSADAQTVSGLITDKQTADPLSGVAVKLKGKGDVKTSYHAVSGLNGVFVFKNVPAGKYEIETSSATYLEQEADIVVNPSTPVKFDLALERKNQSLETVTISGTKEKGSELSALQADRRADIIQNSISARSIEISPDLSVANTAQRVSGISLERSSNGEGQYVIIRGMDKRYIYTQVNGVKIPSPDNKNRYVPLDIFPADMLERLEIFKSLTPDLEGDGIGGAVNMVMKDAPSHFSASANLALGYASKFAHQDYADFNKPSLDRSPRYQNGPTYQAGMNDFSNSGFSHSSKSNPIATQAGVIAGGRLLHNKLGILAGASFQNNFRNVNSVFFSTETSMSNGDAKVTDIKDRHYSIQQQRVGAQLKVDYKLNDKNRLDLFGTWLSMMRNEYRSSSDTNLQVGRTGPGFGSIKNSYRNLHDVQQIFNTTLKGQHQFGKSLFLNWTGAISTATFNRPDEGTLHTSTGVSKDPSTSQPVKLPEVLNESNREFSHSSDEDKSGYLNLTYRSAIGAVKIDWSAGGMYRNKTRTSTYDNYRLRPSNPSSQVYNGDISHNTFTVFNGEGTSNDPLNYKATENVGAAYAMAKLDWKRWLITGGARLENTDLSWISNVDETVYGKTGSITYYDVLPSAGIKYKLNAKQYLRLSYYSAISRPNFYEVVPHNSSDADADYPEQGNPDLKHTTSDNIDLRYEYYPGKLDQFIAGLFYKRIKNPIEYALVNEGTFLFYQASNFGVASNYGLELDMTKYWRSLGIKINYTYTNSSITTTKVLNYSIPGGTTSKTVDQDRPLQGQSKHIGNISLLFKDDNRLGLNAQLAFGYTSERINTVSQFLDNDIWQKGFTQLDFSIEKKLARHWFVYAKIINLLNTPYELEIKQPYTGAEVIGDVKYQKMGENTFVRKDTYGAAFWLGAKFKF